MGQSANQSVNESVSQSGNQSVQQYVNQSVNQSVGQSVNQLISQSLTQSLSQSVNRSFLMTVSCLLFVGLSALFSPPRFVLIPHSVFLPMSQFIQQDLIIRGGQNVYPAEVEYFLHTHPKIQDAQVKRTIEAGVCKAYCKISWFVSGEQMNYLPSLFFNEYSHRLQAICHFYARAVARRRKAWFHVYAWAEYYLQPSTAHKQTIIYRQLYAGHVVGPQPMKWKKNK